MRSAPASPASAAASNSARGSLSVMKDIFWIKGNPPAPLAIVLRPLGDDWLEDELLRLKSSGIQTLVSLLEHWEAGSLGLANEGPRSRAYWIEFSLLPVSLHTCSDGHGFLPELCGRAGGSPPRRRIGWHPLPGQHRQVLSSLRPARSFIWAGSPRRRWRPLKTARGVPVPDTQEQADWILSYTAEP